MNDTKLDSPEAIKAFLGGTDKLDFQMSKTTRYSFLAGTLKRTNYFKLSKKDKGPTTTGRVSIPSALASLYSSKILLEEILNC